MTTYIPLLLPVAFVLVITFGILVGNAGIKSLHEAEAHSRHQPPSK
ncbi:MAG: hypothetical protein HOH29_09710 [Cellvibrionales bacterium]|nr:hypothetical protein [Cellvibrionales bacterium]